MSSALVEAHAQADEGGLGASPKLEDPTQYQEDLNILLSVRACQPVPLSGANIPLQTTTPGSDRGCDYDLNSNSPLCESR